MDDFFKKIKNNEPSLKNFEVEVNPNEAAGQTKEEITIEAKLIKDSHSDNLKFVGSITMPTEMPMKEDVNVSHKPVTIDELEEEHKFNYFPELSLEEPKPKEKEVVNEPNDLEKMLEKAGETTDFLS